MVDFYLDLRIITFLCPFLVSTILTLLTRAPDVAPVITFNGPEWRDRRLGTVGVCIPGMEVLIIDPSTGEKVPNGEDGEVRVLPIHIQYYVRQYLSCGYFASLTCIFAYFLVYNLTRDV